MFLTKKDKKEEKEQTSEEVPEEESTMEDLSFLLNLGNTANENSPKT